MLGTKLILRFGFYFIDMVYYIDLALSLISYTM